MQQQPPQSPYNIPPYSAPPPAPPKRSPLLKAGIIGGIAFLALCLCAVLSLGGGALLFKGGDGDRVDGVTSPRVTVQGGDTAPVQGQDNLSGSNGDDQLRADTLKYLRDGLDDAGCPMHVTDVTVISTADADGRWVEEWTVANCNGSAPFTVTYTPDATGTAIEIRGEAPGS